MHFRRNKSARAAAAIEENVNGSQESQSYPSQDAYTTTQNYQIDQSQYQTPYQTPCQTPCQTPYQAPYQYPTYPADYTFAQTQYSPDGTYNTGVVPPAAPVYNDDGSVQTPPDSIYNDDKSVDSQSQSKSEKKKKDKKKGHHHSWADKFEIGFSLAELGSMTADIMNAIASD